MSASATVYNEYNKLPGLLVADKNFRQELQSAGITLQQLLLELAPLFSEGDNVGTYSVWLPHRHFSLNPGELMVESGNTMAPIEMDPSLQVVESRWNSDGIALEHQISDAGLLPPSPDFMKEFKAILKSHNIQNLGVSYTQMASKGYVYLETTSAEKRMHTTTQVLLESLAGIKTLSTAWIPPVTAMYASSSRLGPSFLTMGGPLGVQKRLCGVGSHVCIGHTASMRSVTLGNPDNHSDNIA